MTDKDELLAKEEAKIRRRQTVRIAVISVLAAIFLAIGLDNLDEVQIGWVVGDAELPLIIALIASFAIGFAVGWLSRRSD